MWATGVKRLGVVVSSPSLISPTVAEVSAMETLLALNPSGACRVCQDLVVRSSFYPC